MQTFKNMAATAQLRFSNY